MDLDQLTWSGGSRPVDPGGPWAWGTPGNLDQLTQSGGTDLDQLALDQLTQGDGRRGLKRGPLGYLAVDQLTQSGGSRPVDPRTFGPVNPGTLRLRGPRGPPGDLG